MATTKATAVRVYLNTELAEQAKATAAALGETEAWVVSKIVEAGLRTIGESGGRFQLPLRFQVEGEEPELKFKPKEAPLPKRKAA